AVRDLHINTRVQGVPTVRMPDGLALSLRNRKVEPSEREKASGLSAALTAGAHAAEHGADAVLNVVRDVAGAAGIELDYAELRARDLGPAPAVGDARLFIAATIGGVQLKDNVGLPLGIGFRNIE
ncbi:MAG: pantoate--beta-alanine ligase, partial [Corynebacterium sp.]|nr:pantoate--beta-alanine ligase [Corynebacterium sp.]